MTFTSRATATERCAGVVAIRFVQARMVRGRRCGLRRDLHRSRDVVDATCDLRGVGRLVCHRSTPRPSTQPNHGRTLVAAGQKSRVRRTDVLGGRPVQTIILTVDRDNETVFEHRVVRAYTKSVTVILPQPLIQGNHMSDSTVNDGAECEYGPPSSVRTVVADEALERERC